jgi:hypothetical protein
MAVGVDHSVAEPFRAFPYGYAQQTAHTQIDVVEVKSSFGQSQSQG